jgi:hypothetical protein
MEKLTTKEFAIKVNLSIIRVQQLIRENTIIAEKRGRDYFIYPKYIDIIKNRPERRGRKLKAA